MPVPPAIVDDSDHLRQNRATADPELILVGRSSSHFTRTAQLHALELGVPCAFRVVLDMTTRDPAANGDNPALYALVTHLPFRKIMDVSGYPRLQAFCREFDERPGARATAYHFDAA